MMTLPVQSAHAVHTVLPSHSAPTLQNHLVLLDSLVVPGISSGFSDEAGAPSGMTSDSGDSGEEGAEEGVSTLS